MPEPLNNNNAGTRHCASLTGKNSLRVSTYAGTSPLNPNPKNADTVNRPISSCVIRNAVSAVAWVAEHTESVIRPPVRSENHPHSCRQRNPLPSTTESMAAPWLGKMPRSEQKAMGGGGG